MYWPKDRSIKAKHNAKDRSARVKEKNGGCTITIFIFYLLKRFHNYFLQVVQHKRTALIALLSYLWTLLYFIAKFNYHFTHYEEISLHYVAQNFAFPAWNVLQMNKSLTPDRNNVINLLANVTFQVISCITVTPRRKWNNVENVNLSLQRNAHVLYSNSIL